MSTSSIVKVIEKSSQNVLFECEISEIESAYKYAAEMDHMGIDVEVKSPTITESLANSLGLNFHQKEEYDNSVIAEIEDHDGSCCTRSSESNQDK